MGRSILERAWESNGLSCAVVDSEMGHRCGYVLVPEGHPWHGLSYNDEVPGSVADIAGHTIDDHGIMAAFIAAGNEEWLKRLEAHVKVHGGLTFGADVQKPWTGGNATTPPGWYIGFDCAHHGDTRDEFTLERVSAEVERLAAQVAAAGVKTCPSPA